MPKESTRRKRWEPYARKLADILRLKDWRIEVWDQLPSNAEADASCEAVYGRKYAVIRFNESFLQDPPADQRHTIAHELIHCHLAPPWKILEGREELTPEMRLAFEYAVDGLADAIAPLLPLPPTSTRSQH